MESDQIIRMLVALTIVLGLMALAVYVLRVFGPRLGLKGVFPAMQSKARLCVVEVALVDARHRMVLVRRDATEHLVLLGGTQPVVIETGIAEEKRQEA